MALRFAFRYVSMPFVVNSSGRLLEDAAALLFHNCLEADSSGPIHVLELGAGCGLFARYFLQAFKLLCEQEGRDFHRRLVYFVTDGSQRTLAQWRERGIFDEFGGQMVPAICDANHVQEILLPDRQRQTLPELRAVFCNYLLDVLPASVIRRGEDGAVQELHVRTRLTQDKELVQRTTRLTPVEIKALLASQDPDQRALLLPLSNLFEYEVDFFPVKGELPAVVLQALEIAPPADRLLVNHGAFLALRKHQRLLFPQGFILVDDYGASTPEAAAESAAPQRFGRTSAIGLNFPLLTQLFECDGWRVAVAAGDETRSIHSRLLLRDSLPRTVSAFMNRFSADAQPFADPTKALLAVAQGLAHDSTGGYVARLLDKQQHILAQMNARRVGEHQRAVERAARLHANA